MQQLQLIVNDDPVITNPRYNLDTAQTELLFEDSSPDGIATVQGFVVQDPQLHGFLHDIYEIAFPSQEVISARKRFERDFAHYHKGEYSRVEHDTRLNRYCIEVVSF